MPTNLEIQEQLVKLQQNVSAELGKQTKEYRSQVDLMEELVTSLRDFPALKDSAKNLENLSAALKNSSMSGKDAESAMERIAVSIRKGSDNAREANNNFVDYFDTLKSRYADVSRLSLAFEGFAEGMKFSINTVKMLGSGVKMTAGIMRQLAVSVITFPFKILRGLMDMAGSSGGSNELAQALEDVRKEFGYLNKTAGGAIVDMARSMKGELANTGLSVYRVFGNLAERLKYFAEAAKNLGPVFDGIASNIAKGAEAYGAYNKGLGLTAEGQRAVGTRAMALGQDVNEVNREIANYSIQLASAFGLTQKQVSRDVGVLMADFSHFGHLAPKELAQISVYARKLGIDVKVLGNVMDKSFNFEDAATQAAQLSQAFGLNIDAMKLMQEQDPAKKMDMLRKSFFAAGKSIETMTAQERRLLAQQTGLDEASLALAFSAKNQSMSYDQVSKKGDMAKKKQLSQTEVLEKLAGAIERITQSGSAMKGGFFDLFFKGFQQGIVSSTEFRKIMVTLRQAMRDTYMAGIKVGRAFVQIFPGVKETFQGIAALFERGRFRNMLNGVKNALTEFFQQVKNGNANAVKNAGTKLRAAFVGWFDSNGEAGKKIINGAKKFFGAIALIANQVLKIGLVKIKEGLNFLTDFLKNPRDLGASLNGGGFFGQIFGSLTKDLLPLLMEVGNSIWELLLVVFGKLKDKAMAHSGAIMGILGGFFAPSIVGSVAKTVFGALGSALATAFVDALKKAFTNKVVTKGVQTAMSGALPQAGTALPAAPKGAMDATAQAVKGASGVADAAQKSGSLTASIIPKLVVIAAIIVGMMLLFHEIKGLLLFVKENRIGPKDAITAGLAFGAVSLLMLAAAGTAAIVEKALGNANFGNLAVGLLAVVAVATVMIVQAQMMLDSFKGLKASDVGNAVQAMKGISILYLGATATILGATIVGAILTATEGLAVAAIAAGLITIALVAQIMAEQSISIIKAISALQVGAGFQTKADAFLAVTKAVGEFAGAFGAIISTGSASIVSVIGSLFGGPSPDEVMRENLSKVERLINVISERIQGIISSIMSAVAGIRNPAEFARSGAALGAMIGAVASLMGALKPPTDVLSESMFELSTQEQKLAAATRFMDAVRDTIMPMVRVVIRMASDFAGLNLSEGQLKSVSAIGTLIGSIGHLAGSLKFDPALLRGSGGAFDQSAVTAVIASVTSFMATMAATLFGPRVLGAITTFIAGVVVAARSIPDADVPKIKMTAELIGKVLEVISSIMGTMNEAIGRVTSESNNSGQNVAAASGILGRMLGFMTGIFGSLRIQLPGLVMSIVAVSRVANLKASDTKKIKSIGDILKTVGETISTISQAAAIGTTGEATVSFTSMIDGFINKFQQIGSALPRLTALMQGTELSTNITAFITAYRTMSIGALTGAIKAMVRDVNSISTELARLTVPNIDVTLRRVSEGLGTQLTRQYQISSRVNVAVNLNVTIDAEDLENSLINRPRTRIASRPAQ